MKGNIIAMNGMHLLKSLKIVDNIMEQVIVLADFNVSCGRTLKTNGTEPPYPQSFK